MIGTGRPAVFYCEEQDSDIEDRPERLKHDKDPVIDEERMSEEEGRCAEPDKISLNADPGRAPLSNQMDDLRHIANKAERDASKPQDLRGVEMHDEAARRGPHHSSFPMVIGPSRSSSPCDCSMLMSLPLPLVTAMADVALRVGRPGGSEVSEDNAWHRTWARTVAVWYGIAQAAPELRRAGPPPACPRSAAAQSDARVGFSSGINVSGSDCSSRRISTGAWEAPTFVELRMDAEIGSYQGAFDQEPDERF